MAQKQDISLSESIKNADTALSLCLCNKFTKAEQFLEPLDDSCIYHMISKATISYLQALLTYEQEFIDKALEKVKVASHLCDRHRKKQTWSETFHSWVGKPCFDDFTELELHAELCYAECLLERALLTFIQDENLISFIKGGLKIRNAHNIYKHCMIALEQKPKQLETNSNKVHFESGVYMGMGSFNVLLSLLPTRVLRLLEWVGFSGNKETGLQLLNNGYKLEGLRSPMCTITLLIYQIVLSPLLAIGDTDVPFVTNILDIYLKKFPQSSIFLYFSGRLKQTQGLLDEALELYEESVSVNMDWQQIHHICYWEMMWCYSFQGKWKEAAEYAEKLSTESKWSKCSYLYMYASFLLMYQFELRHGNIEQVKEADLMTEKIETILDDVGKYKQRIAGKSIPFEKFAVCRVEKYKATGKLVLPGLELIHIWNGFTMFYMHQHTLSHFLHLSQQALDELLIEEDKSKHHKDNMCICKLLQGLCLRYLNETDAAEKVLNDVASSPLSSHSSKMDSYLPPFASAELGFMYRSNNDNSKALHQLQHTLKHYSKYGLESRLHFRVHSGIEALKVIKKKELEGKEEEDFLDIEETKLNNADDIKDVEQQRNSDMKINVNITSEEIETETKSSSSTDQKLKKVLYNGQDSSKDSSYENPSSWSTRVVNHDKKLNTSSGDQKIKLPKNKSPMPSPRNWFRKKQSNSKENDTAPYLTPCGSPTLSEASSNISPVHNYSENSPKQGLTNIVTSL